MEQMINKIVTAKNMAADGEANALEVYIKLKKLETVIKGAISDIKDAAKDEAAKYGEKNFEAFGAIIEVKNGRIRYKYDHIAEITNATANLKLLQERAQTAYKMKEKGIEFVDEQTGEIIKPATATFDADTITIKLKK